MLKSNVIGRLMPILLAGLVLLIPPSIAAASEPDQETPGIEDSQDFAAVVEATYDEMLQLLIFAVNSAGGEPVDCVIPEDASLGQGDEGGRSDGTDAGDEHESGAAAGCTVVDVRGPNGQVTHGQVVSSFVHALKALDRSGIDVPLGRLVRQIAGSDFGKGDAPDSDLAGEADEDSDGVEEDDRLAGPPPHANNDKDKKAKSNGGNNGNGRGPGK